MQICYSHTKQTMQVASLLLWNVLHSVSSWWQQIQTCGDYMWSHCNSCFLLATSIHNVEYSMNTWSGCGCRQCGSAAMEACAAPITQRGLDYETLMQTLCSVLPGDAHLCCLLIGVFHSTAPRRQLFKVTLKLCSRSNVYYGSENYTIWKRMGTSADQTSINKKA